MLANGTCSGAYPAMLSRGRDSDFWYAHDTLPYDGQRSRVQSTMVPHSAPVPPNSGGVTAGPEWYSTAANVSRRNRRMSGAAVPPLTVGGEARPDHVGQVATARRVELWRLQEFPTAVREPSRLERRKLSPLLRIRSDPYAG